MIILQVIENMGYTAYIGSSGNKYIFNIVPSNEPKPSGGYGSLRYICRVKGIHPKDVESMKVRAEEIMGRTLQENADIK